MNAYFLSLSIAAGSGAAWALIQFLEKFLNPRNTQILAWSDWSWAAFARTLIWNTIGGVLAVVSFFLGGSAPSWQIAVISGLYGEKGIDLLLAVVNKLKAKGDAP